MYGVEPLPITPQFDFFIRINPYTTLSELVHDVFIFLFQRFDFVPALLHRSSNSLPTEGI
jgi:hypothetical protein